MLCPIVEHLAQFDACLVRNRSRAHRTLAGHGSRTHQRTPDACRAKPANRVSLKLTQVAAVQTASGPDRQTGRAGRTRECKPALYGPALDGRYSGERECQTQSSGSLKSAAGGSTLDAGEFVMVESDWSSLPDDVVTEPDQVLGRTLVRSIPAGAPITLNLLRQTSVIRAGERVRVQLSGSNFVVAGEGQALQAGAVGEQIRIKMANGQAVSATVVRQGVVEVRVD